MSHEEDVAVGPQVKPAGGHRRLVAAPLDDQDRDVGPTPPQLVGDPREHPDALLGRRVHVRQILRLSRRGHRATEVDQVRNRGAWKPERPAIVTGGEL
jgi:hypothetical protein